MANREHRIQGHAESPLSPRGVRQAQESARWFLDQDSIDAIYSSPLERAFETATLINAEIHTEVTRNSALVELDTGIFTNLTGSEAERRYPAEWAAFQRHSWEAVPQAESIANLAERACGYWHTLVNNANTHNLRAILSVTHGGTLQWLLKCSMGAYPNWMPLIPADNCGIFHLHVRPTPRLSPITTEAQARTPHPGFYAAWKRMNHVAYVSINED